MRERFTVLLEKRPGSRSPYEKCRECLKRSRHSLHLQRNERPHRSSGILPGQSADQLLGAAKAEAEIPPFAFVRLRRLADVFAVVFAALGHIGKIHNNHILIIDPIQYLSDGSDLFRIAP